MATPISPNKSQSDQGGDSGGGNIGGVVAQQDGAQQAVRVVQKILRANRAPRLPFSARFFSRYRLTAIMAVSEAEKKPDRIISRMSAATSALTEISFNRASCVAWNLPQPGQMPCQANSGIQRRTWSRSTPAPVQQIHQWSSERRVCPATRNGKCPTSSIRISPRPISSQHGVMVECERRYAKQGLGIDRAADQRKASVIRTRCR